MCLTTFVAVLLLTSAASFMPVEAGEVLCQPDGWREERCRSVKPDPKEPKDEWDAKKLNRPKGKP